MARWLAAVLATLAVGAAMILYAADRPGSAIAVLVSFGVLGPLFILSTCPDDDVGWPWT
ncbi:MAG TPA: hypothetical protein VMU51_17785 [Mycobacteriales bacterium]|nr:hypothetical protein [Mycobacteriales bacterium]